MVQFPEGAMMGLFLFTTMPILVLGPTQTPIQWVLGALSLGLKLTTQLHLLPRLRIHGATPPLSQYVFTAWYLIKQHIHLHDMVLKDMDNFTFTVIVPYL
jgi:hypothetical protein